MHAILTITHNFLQIQYRLLDDDPDADFIWNRDVYGQQSEAIIIGLRDNTNYWVRVQVFNSAGLGPIGEWRLAETFHQRKYHLCTMT